MNELIEKGLKLNPNMKLNENSEHVEKILEGIKRKNGHESEYDSLYDLIIKPRRVLKKEDALLFEVAHLQDSIAYEGYVSTGERKLERIDEKTGKIYWGELTLNIIPIEAQVLPQ